MFRFKILASFFFLLLFAYYCRVLHTFCCKFNLFIVNNFDSASQLFTGKLCSSNSCFTQRGEEFRGMSTAQHRIRTEDDVPVNQRYRRTLPNQF